MKGLELPIVKVQDFDLDLCFRRFARQGHPLEGCSKPSPGSCRGGHIRGLRLAAEDYKTMTKDSFVALGYNTTAMTSAELRPPRAPKRGPLPQLGTWSWVCVEQCAGLGCASLRLQLVLCTAHMGISGSSIQSSFLFIYASFECLRGEEEPSEASRFGASPTNCGQQVVIGSSTERKAILSRVHYAEACLSHGVRCYRSYVSPASRWLRWIVLPLVVPFLT